MPNQQTTRSAVSQETVATALAEIETASGELTPDAVFEAAQPVDHALHGCFEWNQAEGWRKHNLTIARQLIRSVRVTRIDQERRITYVVPVYVHDPRLPNKEQGYVKIASIAQDTHTANQVLRSEAMRALSAFTRMRDIATALHLSRRLEQLIDDLAALRDELEAA